MSRYLLVDGNALACKLWWAFPADVPARFKATISKVWTAQGAKLYAIAWDSPIDPWRRLVWDQYKAHRKMKPVELSAALKACRAIRVSDDRCHTEADTFEADDVIATLALRLVGRGDEAVILSDDKDLMQLVGPGCWMVNVKGEEIREAQVVARWGVPPDRIRHLLSWMGDVSDGLPGVRGIGPKKAIPLALKGLVGDALTYELAGLATVPDELLTGRA